MDRRSEHGGERWRDVVSSQQLVIESWSEGYLIGSLIVMACITIANMKKRVLLHKLILLEQLLAMFSGTFCFMSFDGYGWYVSATSLTLYCSYFVHNVVAWMKVRPFFVGERPYFSHRVGRWSEYIYVISLILTIGPLIFQIHNDFLFINYSKGMYSRIRPYEFVMRDPWWLSTNIVLLHIIGKTYSVTIWRLIKASPRLGILLVAIIFAISFTIIDLVATIIRGSLSTGVDGINPYWKLSVVFKCLTDAIMLDDFATEMKRITANIDPTHDVVLGRGPPDSRSEKRRDIPQPAPSAQVQTGRTRSLSRPKLQARHKDGVASDEIEYVTIAS